MGSLDFFVNYWNYSKTKDPKGFNLNLLILSLIIGIIAFSYIDRFTKNILLASGAFILISLIFNLGLSAKEIETGAKIRV